jgi:phosphoribosyl 1,2-cyclic phosphodiesterase
MQRASRKKFVENRCCGGRHFLASGAVSEPVQFTILGSGSNGNCAYLEAGETRLLIDAGFSARQIRERLAQIGRAPEGLSGILLTHEHTDHTNGLGTLCSKLAIPIYCNRLTKEAVEVQFEDTKFDFRLFSTGAAFEVGCVGIETFSVPHDAYDPVGYMLRTHGRNIGFLTDLGHATKLVVERVRQSHVLVLETNHDMKLLQDDVRRPWSVKQRILSRHGHLSNDAAANVLAELVSAELEHVFLGHLSRDCNRPDLALKTVQKRLDETGATHVHVNSTSQDTRCETLTLCAIEGRVISQGTLPFSSGELGLF